MTLVVGELQVQSMSCSLLGKRTCHWDVLLVTLDRPKTADKLFSKTGVEPFAEEFVQGHLASPPYVGRPFRSFTSREVVKNSLWDVRFCPRISFKRLYQPSVSRNQCNCTKVCTLCKLSHGSRKQLNTLGAKPSNLESEQDSKTISVCIGKVSFLQFCTSNPLADTFRPTTLVVGELQVQSMSCRLLCKRTCHWDVLLVTLDWPKTADKLDKLDKVYGYGLCGPWRNLQNTQWVSGCCLLLWWKHRFVRFCLTDLVSSWILWVQSPASLSLSKIPERYRPLCRICTSNPLADTFKPMTLVVGELQVHSMSCSLLDKRTCHWDVLLVTLDWPKTADKLDKLDKVHGLCGRWRNLQNTQWVSGCCLLLWWKHRFVRFCLSISLKRCIGHQFPGTSASSCRRPCSKFSRKTSLPVPCFVFPGKQNTSTDLANKKLFSTYSAANSTNYCWKCPAQRNGSVWFHAHMERCWNAAKNCLWRKCEARKAFTLPAFEAKRNANTLAASKIPSLLRPLQPLSCEKCGDFEASFFCLTHRLQNGWDGTIFPSSSAADSAAVSRGLLLTAEFEWKDGNEAEQFILQDWWQRASFVDQFKNKPNDVWTGCCNYVE